MQVSEIDVLLWLHASQSLTFTRFNQVLNCYPSLLSGLDDGFSKLDGKWRPMNCQKIDTDLQVIKSRLDLDQVSFKTIFDVDYPKTFRSLSSPPLVLYYQGDWGVLARNMVLTVVGSRNYDVYAEQSIKKLLTPAVESGLIVASGLAYGVDSLAHQVSVSQKSPTIGIIGSGLDRASFYPQRNLSLKSQMIEFGGLIVSEYYIGTEPRTFNFPARNRLLAALSRVTLVVQAHHKSGSLITAREAIEQGKTVVTLPARIIDGGYSGNLELIKNGAHIVTSSQELCDLVGLEQRQMDFQKPEFGSDLEMRIYESLSIDPLEFDILSQKLNLDTTELATHLSMMELQGYVKNIGENRWVALV